MTIVKLFIWEIGFAPDKLLNVHCYVSNMVDLINDDEIKELCIFLIYIWMHQSRQNMAFDTQPLAVRAKNLTMAFYALIKMWIVYTYTLDNHINSFYTSYKYIAAYV